MAPTDSDDVDRTLRHVAQRFPDELARALLPEARSLTKIAWTDTQLASRERRLDKSLYVVADGEARVEHAEWQLRWSRGLLARMYEYHALLTIALRDAAKPGERVPSVRSTVVLLGGREAPWPAVMRYRTTPRGEAFSGLRETAARRAQLESEASAEVLHAWFSRALTAERVADVFRDAR